MTVYTIGHSTHALPAFVSVLQAHGIELLADIRSYPASRRMPWFQGPQAPPFMNAEEARRNEALETTLPREGIEYVWLPSLGGRRKKIRDDSPNGALCSPSFRNYADYMLTPEFQAAARQLTNMAANQRTCVMCAESQVYYHCHRMLLSDYLAANGHTVLHISGKGEPKPHRITPEARVEEGKVTYPGEKTLFGDL